MTPTLVLPGGTRVHIRPIRPDDKPLVAAGFRLLSDETRTKRFLGPKPKLTAAELRYLTEVDGCDHFALVAVDVDHPTHILAVGRFVRDATRRDTAEFAIVVGDPYQRQGLGRELARRLTDAARVRGVRRFTAWTLSDNLPVQRLIASIAEHLDFVPQGNGAREVVAELAA